MAYSIYDKLKDLGTFTETHSVKETEKYIKDNFEELSLVNNEYINYAYYQSDVTKYFLKDSWGTYIKIVKGDGDRFGSNHSHNGTDIIIGNIGDDSDFPLFLENEKQGKFDEEWIKHIKDVLDHLNTNLSAFKAGSLNYFEDYNTDITLFKLLPEEMQKDSEVIDAVVSLLTEKAASIHYDQVDYESISPYGGLDVVVEEEHDIFYNLACELDTANNELLKEKIEKQYFSYEGKQTEIKENILILVNQLYVLENEENYLKLDKVFNDFKEKCEAVNVSYSDVFNETATWGLEDEISYIEDEINELNFEVGKLKAALEDMVKNDSILRNPGLILRKNRALYDVEKQRLSQDIIETSGSIGRLKAEVISFQDKIDTVNDISDELQNSLKDMKIDICLFRHIYNLPDPYDNSETMIYDLPETESAAELVAYLKKNKNVIENKLEKLKSLIKTESVENKNLSLNNV